MAVSLPAWASSPMMNAIKSGNTAFGGMAAAVGRVPGLLFGQTDQLYDANREWAEAQAQKQMDFQSAANKLAMDFNAVQADKERAFQTEMANSAYQRAVQDLKAAGLNPILAYSQGGAAMPSVSSAQGVSSAGAHANMVDTGYESSKIKSQFTSAMYSSTINAAASVFGSLVKGATSLFSSFTGLGGDVIKAFTG